MRGTIWVIVAMVAVGSFCSLLSPIYWGFDLINHLRPQALVVSFMVVGFAIFFGRLMVSAAILVVTGNIVLFVSPLIQNVSSPVAPQSTEKILRIFSANVRTQNRRYDLLLDLIEKAQPDIVLLTETDRRWGDALSSLKATYPHRLLHPHQGNFGMAVYSKQSFDGKVYSDSSIRVPFATLRFEGFTIFNIHPIPPVGPRQWRANVAYLQELALQTESLDYPVIVAGDFNSTIWGDAMEPLSNAGLLPLGGFGMGYTWPAGNPFLRMQIDFIMGREVFADDLQILPSIGSDHFPVMADVYLRPSIKQ